MSLSQRACEHSAAHTPEWIRYERLVLAAEALEPLAHERVDRVRQARGEVVLDLVVEPADQPAQAPATGCRSGC